MTTETQIVALVQAVGADVKALRTGPHAILPVGAAGYVSFSHNASALVTVAGGLNRLDFMPFIPASNMTVNELAIEVTTVLAVSQVHVGIYADAAGAPAAKLVGTTTPLDSTVLGVKVVAVSQALVAGTRYWIAVLTSATQTLRAIPVAALIPLSAPASGTAIPNLRRATAVFATGLPATAPATTPTSAIAPWVRMRLV